jgi:hypothetical protein
MRDVWLFRGMAGSLAAGAWLVFAQGDLERALVMATLGVFSLIGSRVVLAEEANRERA